VRPPLHRRVELDGWIAETRQLTLEERGLYVDLKVLIGERGGVLARPRDDDFCRLLAIDPRRLRRVLGRLVMLGKIEVTEHALRLGTSVGLPADIGATSLGSRPDLRGTSAGLPGDLDPGGERNQGDGRNGKGRLAHPLSSSIGETRKKEDPAADAAGAGGGGVGTGPGWDAGQPPGDVIWGPALDWLSVAEGRAKETLRSMVGRWCKAHGEMLTLAVIVECRQATPPIVGPVAWIEAALQLRNRGNGKRRDYGGERRGGATAVFMAAARAGGQAGHD
jgi:hypothetical protein